MLTTHARGRATRLMVDDNAVCDLTGLMREMHIITPPTKELLSTHFYHGSRWHSIQQLYGNTAQTQVFATSALPTAIANNTIALHLVLLDIAGSAVEQLPGFCTDLVPFLYRDLRLYRPLPSTLHVALTVNRHDEEGDSYASTLCDVAGEMIVRCAAMVKHKAWLHIQDVDDDTRLRVSSADSYQLRLAAKGEGVGKLALYPAPRLVLGDLQVEIEVLATGSNFKDVLFITGLLRQQPGEALLQLGLERAGRITRVGKNITEFAPGEDAMAVLNGGSAQYVRVESDCVVRKPAHCHIERAVALPIVYLTAHCALMVRVNLQPGEQILIHSVAGGVGLTALHTAKRCGAQIFATAGSKQKRDCLFSLGVHAVADSHDEQFIAILLVTSDEQGMNVILNSLTGRLLDANLALLVPLGRFLELGNKDIAEDKALPMRSFAQGGTLIPINLYAVHGAFSRCPQQIVTWIDDDALPFSPCKPVLSSEVTRAPATPATPQHIGKVVVAHRTAAGTDRLDAMIAERRLGGYVFSMSNAKVMRQLQLIPSTRSSWTQLPLSPRATDRLTRGNRANRDVPSTANDTITQQTVKKRPRLEIDISYSPAAREVERMLCQILEEYLGLDRVDIDDNYAELGATSFDMVQLSGRMARHYPQVSVVSLYNHATVCQPATLCQPLEGESSTPSPQPAVQTNTRANQIAKCALQIAKNTACSHTSLH